ncbi:MAG: YgiT-type zinc finger protein [Anaerolineales bacterium]|nr:YgiT-type zinc finger protein [Anaerolineales bacterium]MCX7753634.1 YgiT-type zinc finger protein [Anaerolineales bacterium]MDW8277716.1 YgiT-type zinc finger protein [Anaerolineales bacterium]
MSEPSSSQPSTFPCGDCQAGVMRLQFITYFTWLGDELVMVPGFPAWICDVCGRREYDERAVSWLSTLLSPNAGKTTLRRKPRRNVPSPKREPSRPSSAE